MIAEAKLSLSLALARSRSASLFLVITVYMSENYLVKLTPHGSCIYIHHARIVSGSENIDL